MTFRTGETPMEFEYQNKAGKMDESSPFAKLRPGTFSNQAFGSSFAHNTPSRKPTFAVPYLPQTPKTQADRFRDRFDTDASSGTEQSSPEAADTEETPAIRKLNQNVTISRGHGTTPSKPSPLGTKSFFGSGLFTSNAIRKERLRNANQHAALVRKSHKRKRRELERDNQISFEWPNHQDSDYDDTSRPGTSEGPPTERPAKEVGTIPAILGFIHAHPDLPAILARYGHSLLSWFIVMMFIYMTYAFWAAIKQDVDIKKGEFSAKILSEMAICGKHYIDNRCAPGMRAPALKDLCEEWDMCMHQDPDAVGQAKVSAHTWAEIFSAFVEPLSYKLMGFFLAVLIVICVLPNALFGRMVREGTPSVQTPYPSTPHFPTTPYRGQYDTYGNDRIGSSYHERDMGMGYRDGRDNSPTRRLGRSESPAKRIGYL